MENPQTKICSNSKCSQANLTFSKNKNNIDGLQNYCKICSKEKSKLLRRTQSGLIAKIYTSQKLHSKRRKQDAPKYSFIELEIWMLNQNKFHELYKKWVKNNYDRKSTPSIDRKNEYKGYEISNIQLMTWEENNKKCHKDIIRGVGKSGERCKAVLQYSLDNNFIAEFHSQAEASRHTEALQSHISSCCKEKRNHAGGFKWKYK